MSGPTKRILFNCAPSGIGNGANFGMQTVDYAAHNLMSRLGLSKEQAIITHPWRHLQRDVCSNRASEEFDKWPMVYQETWGDLSPRKDDLVLVWGDFQLGLDYQVQSARRFQSISRKRGVGVTDGEAIDWAYRAFLLEDILADNNVNVATYGTTLFQNGMCDWTDSRYVNAVSNVLSRSIFSKFRDPYSAWVADRLTGHLGENHWGIDAAFLNSPSELLDLPTLQSPAHRHSSTVGVYFGRSTANLKISKVSLFVRQLARIISADCMWIPWDHFSGGNLFGGFLRQFRRYCSGIKEIAEPFMSGDILHSLSSCRIVVTDTYHVAVNCMCLGTPVVCIYEPTPRELRNANMGYRESWRDKRALLYLSTNQADMLVPSGDLNCRRMRLRKVEHIASLIRDNSAIEFWRDWVSQERSLQRDWLDSQLRRLLFRSGESV